MSGVPIVLRNVTRWSKPPGTLYSNYRIGLCKERTCRDAIEKISAVQICIDCSSCKPRNNRRRAVFGTNRPTRISAVCTWEFCAVYTRNYYRWFFLLVAGAKDIIDAGRNTRASSICKKGDLRKASPMTMSTLSRNKSPCSPVHCYSTTIPFQPKEVDRVNKDWC